MHYGTCGMRGVACHQRAQRAHRGVNTALAVSRHAQHASAVFFVYVP